MYEFIVFHFQGKFQNNINNWLFVDKTVPINIKFVQNVLKLYFPVQIVDYLDLDFKNNLTASEVAMDAIIKTAPFVFSGSSAKRLKMLWSF